MKRGEDQLSGLICQLCSLLLTLLRTPHIALPTADGVAACPVPSPRRAQAVASGRRSQVSPAGFASLMLGASLAMMLCGSVTFVIGFILMPWVLGIVLLFYFVGFLSNLSGLGRSILCSGASSDSAGTSPKEMSGSSFFQTSDYLDMKWQLMNE